MAEQEEVLFVIPARGGSKRLPRKNVRKLGGKPLICWTIDAALAANIKGLIVVTSDDQEVLDIAQSYKNRSVLSHKRPSHLAEDSSTLSSVLVDATSAIRQTGFNPSIIVLLQPTSPLRNNENINEALELFENTGGVDSVVSVSEIGHPSAWVGEVMDDFILNGLDLSYGRSQDHKKEYCLNGAIYVVSADFLMTEGRIFTPTLRAYVMPREYSVDIDEEIDFRLAEALIHIE